MENLPRILCLDCDDVIFRSGPLVNKIVSQLEYKASDEYLKKITYEMEIGRIDPQTYRILTSEYYELKDQILEELSPKYANKIDYSKIYVPENTYPNVIEYINNLCTNGYFEKVYIVSHCNVQREIVAKKNFFKKYLPLVELIPIKFHASRYFVTHDRKRTNKGEYIKLYLEEKGITNYLLIDDSSSNITEWEKQDGMAVQFKEGSTDVNQISSLNPSEVMEVYESRRKR